MRKIQALILTPDEENRNINKTKETSIYSGKPLIESRIERLKKLGITEIIIVTKPGSEKIQENHIEEHIKIVEAENWEKGFLALISSAKELINDNFLVTYENAIYPFEILRIMSEINLASDILLGVDKGIKKFGEDDVKVNLSEDLPRPKIKEIGKGIENADATSLSIFLCSTIVPYECNILLNNEGEKSDLFSRLDSRALPFNNVDWIRADTDKKKIKASIKLDEQK